MSLAKTSSLIVVGTLGLGAPMTIGVHQHTKDDIWSQIKDDAIPDDSKLGVEDSAWTALKTTLDQKSDINTPSLNALKNLSEGNTKGEKIKEWCFASYKLTFRSLISSSNESLLKDVRSICIRKIEDQLGNEKINFSESETGESKLKNKLNSLKTHDNNNGELDDVLKKLKSEIEAQQEDNKWTELKAWCQSAYNKGCQGHNSNTWKLVDTYCKNT